MLEAVPSPLHPQPGSTTSTPLPPATSRTLTGGARHPTLSEGRGTQRPYLPPPSFTLLLQAAQHQVSHRWQTLSRPLLTLRGGTATTSPTRAPSALFEKPHRTGRTPHWLARNRTARPSPLRQGAAMRATLIPKWQAVAGMLAGRERKVRYRWRDRRVRQGRY